MGEESKQEDAVSFTNVDGVYQVTENSEKDGEKKVLYEGISEKQAVKAFQEKLKKKTEGRMLKEEILDDKTEVNQKIDEFNRLPKIVQAILNFIKGIRIPLFWKILGIFVLSVTLLISGSLLKYEIEDTYPQDFRCYQDSNGNLYTYYDTRYYGKYIYNWYVFNMDTKEWEFYTSVKDDKSYPDNLHFWDRIDDETIEQEYGLTNKEYDFYYSDIYQNRAY